MAKSTCGAVNGMGVWLFGVWSKYAMGISARKVQVIFGELMAMGRRLSGCNLRHKKAKNF